MAATTHLAACRGRSIGAGDRRDLRDDRPRSYYRGIAETRVIDDDDTLTGQEADLLEISGQDVLSVTFGLSISFSF
jgi:hypothetical protein